jgi:hypothetical protein
MEMATELVNSNEIDFMRAGVGAIWDEAPDLVKSLLFSLRQHSQTEVRRLAIAYFVTRYPKERLESILQEYMEVMQGAPGKVGQATCKALLSQFNMEYLMPVDMDWAMQQMEKYRLSHGIGMNDCLIASVVHRLQLLVYTHHLKAMRALLDESLVIKPY